MEVNHELETLSQKISNRAIPQLATSKEVSSPVLWAWSCLDRILIPQGVDGKEIPAGVYLHELAHQARRDHVWAFRVGLVLCLLPWHPLVWITRRHMSDRAEETYDDWVISCGCQLLDYADELVKMAPSRVGALTMAAVSKSSRLKERVSRLVTGVISAPMLSRKWVIGLVGSGVILLVVLAFIQPGARKSEDPSKVEEEEIPNQEQTPLVMLESGKIPEQKIQVMHDGKPLSGARVWVEKYPINTASKIYQTEKPLITGVDGFVKIDLSEIENCYSVLYVEKEGKLSSILKFWPSVNYHETIDMYETQKIKGKITYKGKPLVGVRCKLVSFRRSFSRIFGNYMGVFDDCNIPYGWKDLEVKSDEKGEFSFDGIPLGHAGTVLLDKEGFGLVKISIARDQKTEIEMVPAGDLQIAIQGKGTITDFANTAWMLLDLGESNPDSPGLRTSYTRLWRYDSLGDGKISRLGAGKYQLVYKNLGNVPYQFRFEPEVEIEPGKTTVIRLEGEPAAQISGKLVEESTGKGVGGVELWLNGKTCLEKVTSETCYCTSKKDGSFTVYCSGDEGGEKKYNLEIYPLLLFKQSKRLYFHNSFSDRDNFNIEIKPTEKIKAPDISVIAGLDYQADIIDKQSNLIKETPDVLISIKVPKQGVYVQAKRTQVSQGKFRINNLDPKNLVGFLVRKGKAVNIPEELQPPGQLKSNPIMISEDFGVLAKGVLLDVQGKPLANTKLELNLNFVLLDQTQTKEDGTFQFSGLWLNQEYQVKVNSEKKYKSIDGSTFRTPKTISEKLDQIKIVID